MSRTKILIILLLAFFTLLAIGCCKVSGDSEEDAQRSFERWLKEKNDKASESLSEGGTP